MKEKIIVNHGIRYFGLLLTLASAILYEHVMLIKFFATTSIKQQEFNYNNLNECKKLIIKLE